MNKVAEQGEAAFMPRAGTNSSRAAEVQLLLVFNVLEYWPSGQRSQASSAGVVHLNGSLPEKPDFVENGTTSTFK